MKGMSFSRDRCGKSLDQRRGPKKYWEAISILRAFCRDLRSVGKAGAVPRFSRFVEKRYLILHNVQSSANMRAIHAKMNISIFAIVKTALMPDHA